MELYTLTQYTGARSNDLRTMTVATLSMRPRVVLVAGLSAIPAVIVTAVLWPFVDYYAVIAFIIVEATLLWAFVAKTSDSRQIPQYRALADAAKAKASVGKFYVGKNRVDPSLSQFSSLISSTTPVGQVDHKVREVYVDQKVNWDAALLKNVPKKRWKK